MGDFQSFKRKFINNTIKEDLAIASFKEVVWKYDSEYGLTQRLTNPKDTVYLDEFEIDVVKQAFGDSSYNASVKQKMVQMIQGDNREVSVTIQKHATGWFMCTLRIMTDTMIENFYLCPQIGKDGLAYLCEIIKKEIEEYKKEENE
jgi:hypothetical protein